MMIEKKRPLMNRRGGDQQNRVADVGSDKKDQHLLKSTELRCQVKRIGIVYAGTTDGGASSMTAIAGSKEAYGEWPRYPPTPRGEQRQEERDLRTSTTPASAASTAEDSLPQRQQDDGGGQHAIVDPAAKRREEEEGSSDAVTGAADNADNNDAVEEKGDNKETADGAVAGGGEQHPTDRMNEEAPGPTYMELQNEVTNPSGYVVVRHEEEEEAHRTAKAAALRQKKTLTATLIEELRRGIRASPDTNSLPSSDSHHQQQEPSHSSVTSTEKGRGEKLQSKNDGGLNLTTGDISMMPEGATTSSLLLHRSQLQPCDQDTLTEEEIMRAVGTSLQDVKVSNLTAAAELQRQKLTDKRKRHMFLVDDELHSQQPEAASVTLRRMMERGHDDAEEGRRGGECREEERSGSSSSPQEERRTAVAAAAAAAVRVHNVIVRKGTTHDVGNDNDGDGKADDGDDAATRELSPSMKQFLLKEEELESRRFRAELWLEKLTFILSVKEFIDARRKHLAALTILDVATPFIRRKLAVWKKKAARIQYSNERVQSHDTLRSPANSAVFLQKMNIFFLDWPLNSIQELLDAATPVSFKEREYIFHSGDVSTDMYIVLQGMVEVIIIDEHNHQKKKSKGASNGEVVTTIHPGGMFGEKAGVLHEPRSASIRCAADTDLLCFTLNDFVRAATVLPHATRLNLERLSTEQWTRNVKSILPVKQHHLQESPIFKCWHAAGIQDLMAAFKPIILRKGTVLYRPGDVDFKAYYLVSGDVEIIHGNTISSCSTSSSSHHQQDVVQEANFAGLLQDDTAAVAQGGAAGDRGIITPQTMSTMVKQRATERKGKGAVFGEEQLVFGEPRTSTATCMQTCESYFLDRADYVVSSLDYPPCAIDSRAVVNNLRARRLIKPPKVPTCVLKHPVLHYLMPDDPLREVWEEEEEGAITPKVLAGGEALFNSGESARSYLYVVVSGALYERRQQSSSIHHGKRGRGGGGGYGFAENSPVRGSQQQQHSFGGSPSRRGVVVGGRSSHNTNDDDGEQPVSPAAGYRTDATDTSVLPQQILVEDTPHGGLVFGAVEFALQSSTFLTSVHCTSTCIIWQVCRKTLERVLQRRYQMVWSAILSLRTVVVVSQAVSDPLKGGIESLDNVEGPPRNAGLRSPQIQR